MNRSIYLLASLLYVGILGCGTYVDDVADNDIIPPEVSILYPAQLPTNYLQTVAGIVAVVIRAVDNVKVTTVHIRVDGTFKGSFEPPSPEFSYNWDTTGLLTTEPSSPEVLHTFTVIAFDAEGNSTTASTQVRLQSWQRKGSTYTDFLYRFSLQVPLWVRSIDLDSVVNPFSQVDETPFRAVFRRDWFGADSPYYCPTVAVARRKGPERSSVAMAQSLFYQISAARGAYAVSSPELTEWGGARVAFSFTAQNTDGISLSMRGYVYCIVIDGIGHSVWIGAPSQEFARYEGSLNVAVSSYASLPQTLIEALFGP